MEDQTQTMKEFIKAVTEIQDIMKPSSSNDMRSENKALETACEHFASILDATIATAMSKLEGFENPLEQVIDHIKMLVDGEEYEELKIFLNRI